MKDTETLGKKIRELRLINNFSLRDLEEKSGVSYSFIASIEKNRYQPSREKLIAIIDALRGANKDELLLLAGFAPMNLYNEIANKRVDLSEAMAKYNHLSPHKKKIIDDLIEALSEEDN